MLPWMEGRRRLAPVQAPSLCRAIGSPSTARKSRPRGKGLPAHLHMLCHADMADERASEAIGRIERALARIDTALARPQPAQPAPQNDLAMAELAARHESLRGETRRAIADLDALIGSNA